MPFRAFFICIVYMKVLFTTICLVAFSAMQAQSKGTEKPLTQQELHTTIVALDKVVFEAYNNCDVELFKTYFSDDAEFYHDKGGVTLGAEKLAESVQKNLCSNPELKIHREVVPGTLQVYPMDNYGAILTGEHYFYEVTATGKKPTGRAKFTHLWQYKDGKWKMTRVLSYDHQPAQ